MVGMEIKAIIHEAEEGGYWAEVPELPGCFTQGETLEEVKANVVEAAQCWLEAQVPELITFTRPRRAPARRVRHARARRSGAVPA